MEGYSQLRAEGTGSHPILLSAVHPFYLRHPLVHRVVVTDPPRVLTFQRGIHGKKKGDGLLLGADPPKYLSPCSAAYVAVNNAMRKSHWLRHAARKFIEVEFGKEPFVAAHVRPYMDECMEVSTDCL